MTPDPKARKIADEIFLNRMLFIAQGNLLLKARAYLYYSIARCLGGIQLPGDKGYVGCGISKIWATSEKDKFFPACQLHDEMYSKLKNLE